MSIPSWPRAYRHLAELLRDFYDKHKDLSGRILFSIAQDFKLADNLFPFFERFREQKMERFIDPINVFASFNGLHLSDEQRIVRYNFWLELLYMEAGEKFDLVPEMDFAGCPTPRTSMIIVMRSVSHQLQIWRFFAHVVTLGRQGLSAGVFEESKSWKGVGIPTLTMFLFWIDSVHFLALDNHTVTYLREQGWLKSRFYDFQTYQQLLNDTTSLDYVEQSVAAYEFGRNYIIAEPYREERQPKGVKKNKQKRTGQFKLIGLCVLENTIAKWQRVLERDTPYLFSKAYDISDPDFVAYNPQNDLRLYNVGDMSISISAVVGKNGSGKSSIVDLIYIILNNLSQKHPDVKDYMEYVPGVCVDFYYASEDVYCIQLRDDEMSIKRYVVAPGGYRFDQKPIEVADFNLEDLFYSVSLNYAHFALNSEHIGDWINNLFHKNDAYQQPLVLNPHRNEGNIDVNEEEGFANTRLLSNLLYYDETIKDDPKLKMFRQLTDKQQAEKIRLTLNLDKVGFLFVLDAPTAKKPDRKVYGQWVEAKEYWVDFVRKVETEFGLASASIPVDPLGASKLPEIAYRYILKKVISISFKYRKYRGEYVRTKRKFKDLEEYLKKLNADDTHITFKLKQAINYLKYNHISQFIQPSFAAKEGDGYDLPINGLAKDIYDLTSKEDGSKLVHMIPPSFFKPEVILTDKVKLSSLSSGEKQRIFAVSTIAYHLINIDSANNDESQVSYKFANIIFDEIELYYHPEMQRTFVDYLLRYISYLPIELAGLNITFITHSPFILSDIPADNILFLGGERSGWLTFGSNIHDLLADSFFLDDGFMGEHVKKTIQSLAAFLSDAPRVGSFNWDKPSAERVITAIGEPLIRDRLTSLLNKKFDSENHRQERIRKLRKELEELEK